MATTDKTTGIKILELCHDSYGSAYAAHIAKAPAAAHADCRTNIPHADDPECRLVTDDDERTITKPSITNEITMIQIQK
jgi:hypothetical protein